MPIICRFFGISIYMYYKDHNPPHFHAYYNGNRAVFDINTFALLEGKLPPRGLGLVLEWAEIHRSELHDNWKKAQNGDKLTMIEPLS
jgi:hypothetical protein